MTDESDVIRNKALVRWCRWFAVASLLFTPILVSTAPDPGAGIAIVIVGLVTAAVFYRGTRMRVEMTDDALHVYNLFRTERVAWTAISDVSVDYGGLRIELVDGQAVTVGSLGKPNWATWMHREVDADRWARRIEARAAATRPPG